MNKEKQIKATLPSGFKDRSGDELALKKKLLNIIEKNFIKFGFSPLETSPMELSSVIGNSLAEDDENPCLLYTSPSPRDGLLYRMPSSA